MSLIKPAKRNSQAYFLLANRKYLGSKRLLAEKITEIIISMSGLPKLFFEGFLGTGAVTARFLEKGLKKIIVCDNLFANIVIFEGFSPLGKKQNKFFLDLLKKLNSLEGFNGYITSNFADTYFTKSNCLLMDAIREEIERLKNKKLISNQIWLSLLASFLLATDRVANTTGQYDAYLKNLNKKVKENGKHLIDKRVLQPFKLLPLKYLPVCEKLVFNTDIFKIINEIEADTAYFDPPYNTRQYCDNYHLLENIARWEKPICKGKTKKMERFNLKSPFSNSKQALKAIENLIELSKSRHIYLSYNSEGICRIDELFALLKKYGKAHVFEIPYFVFGGGAGVAQKRKIIEYLFYLEKSKLS